MASSRDRIRSVLSGQTVGEVAVVSAYETICYRDHWRELSDVPWWYHGTGDPRMELAWARSASAATGIEWLSVGGAVPRHERARTRYEPDGPAVWRVDVETGARTRLEPPRPSGVGTGVAVPVHPGQAGLPTSEEEVDALIPAAEPFDREAFIAEGRHDAVASIQAGTDLCVYGHVSSPVWSLYSLLGYEGLMLLMAMEPELVAYAARRALRNTVERVRTLAALGADCVWIEECLTDQISRTHFAHVNLPVLQRLVEAIGDAGLFPVYYYCGDPTDRLDLLLEAGADGLHLEEGKKGFEVDIADVCRRVDGRCCVFGNLDSVWVLQEGSPADIAAEVRRQVAAGRRNAGRFAMSTGSPITPETSLERVAFYAGCVRELRR
jgi:uroporphyrinogen-III decarboxylase